MLEEDSEQGRDVISFSVNRKALALYGKGSRVAGMETGKLGED